MTIMAMIVTITISRGEWDVEMQANPSEHERSQVMPDTPNTEVACDCFDPTESRNDAICC